jgi:uncharacterized protein (TIGR00369 family)
MHGGTSVVIAEGLASLASWLNAPTAETPIAGLEINANHLKRAKVGDVLTAATSPLHRGRRTQVWEIKINNQLGELVCAARCTVMVGS